MATVDIQFDSHALQSASVSGAPLALLTGVNIDTFVRAFDDTDEEFVWGKFDIPSNIDSSKTVSFVAAVVPLTAEDGVFVQHRFGYVSLADGEDFDIAYTDVDSGDKEIDYTVAKDDISIHTWTSGVAGLDWVADDLVLFRYSRIAPTGTDLTGDMDLLNFTIKIPV